MGYVYANNDFQGGTLLNRTNFESLFPFVYFDLTKQKMDIKDGVTKLAFHYELSANPNANYNIYAIVLHERVAEIEQQGGKLLLRAYVNNVQFIVCDVPSPEPVPPVSILRRFLPLRL